MKKAPIPLFNYKKRPRQALLSDPSQTATSGPVKNNASVSPHESNLSTTSSDLRVRNNQINTDSYHMNRAVTLRSGDTGTGLMNHRGEMSARGRQQTSTQARNLRPTTQTTLTNSFNRGARNPNTFQNRIGPPETQSPREQNSFANRQCGPNKDKSLLKTNEIGFNQRSTGLSRSSFSGYNNNQRNQNQTGMTGNKAGYGQIHRNQSYSNAETLRKNIGHEMNNTSGIWAQKENVSLQQLASKTPLGQTRQKSATDNSLRVFTFPINVAKSVISNKFWSCPTLFEIYGLVDSATLQDKTGTGKEFVLRDDTDRIKCVFYEIDREMPRLIRGQTYRVVGLIQPPCDSMHVLSVRHVDMEERALYEKSYQLSQSALYQLDQHNNEP